LARGEIARQQIALPLQVRLRQSQVRLDFTPLRANHLLLFVSSAGQQVRVPRLEFRQRRQGPRDLGFGLCRVDGVEALAFADTAAALDRSGHEAAGNRRRHERALAFDIAEIVRRRGSRAEPGEGPSARDVGGQQRAGDRGGTDQQGELHGCGLRGTRLVEGMTFILRAGTERSATARRG
jgi:hypothetical protein